MCVHTLSRPHAPHILKKYSNRCLRLVDKVECWLGQACEQKTFVFRAFLTDTIDSPPHSHEPLEFCIHALSEAPPIIVSPVVELASDSIQAEAALETQTSVETSSLLRRSLPLTPPTTPPTAKVSPTVNHTTTHKTANIAHI